MGYSLTMHRIRGDELEHLQMPGSYNKKRTAGFICLEMFDKKYASMLCELDIPTLFVDSPVIGLDEPLRTDCLYMENQNNIFSFVKEMIRRGKRKSDSLENTCIVNPFTNASWDIETPYTC